MIDSSPAIEAARQFFSGPSVTIEAPKDPLYYDAFTCDLFVLHVVKPGAETDIMIRVFKSEACNTHPGERQ